MLLRGTMGKKKNKEYNKTLICNGPFVSALRKICSWLTKTIYTTKQDALRLHSIVLYVFLLLCLFAAHKKNPLEISGDKKRLEK